MKNSDWTNRRGVLVTSGVALFCLICGTFLTQWLSGPNFYPTSLLLTDAEQKPVERVDLSDESLACDAAVRSMLLAFADEDEEVVSLTERAKSAVESPYAIIPEECRSRIDDGFVVSADGVRAELRTARLVEDKIVVSFVLTNAWQNQYRFAFGSNEKVFVNPSVGTASAVRLSSLPFCSSSCGTSNRDWYSTAVDEGRSILVHLETKVSPGETPDSVTIIVPIVRWRTYNNDREIRLSFNDVPLDRADFEASSADVITSNQE